ncbi:MAG: 50S ribosomal protein L24 [Oceanococcus sp.]
MNRLRKGDDVVITAGRDKGRRGTVLTTRQDDRVLVEGINMVKKHVKPNPNTGVQGGIVEQEAALHVSNVMLFNPKTEKGDRVSFKVVDGVKQRVYRSTGEVVGG